MPNIPLSLDEQGKIFLYIQLFSPGIPNPKPLKIYLDTGASHTTLSLKDAEEMGIAAGNLRSSEITNYGYGGRMDVRKLPEVCMVFIRDDKSTVPVCMDSIQVNYTYSAVKKKDKDKIVYGMPSVLGVDSLSRAAFGLHVNWKDKTAYLSSA